MMCEEMIFEYWFSTIRKLSARKKYLLRELIGSGKKIYYIEETEITGIEFLTEEEKEGLKKRPERENERTIKRRVLQNAGTWNRIYSIFFTKEYPPGLAEIPDPPFALFVKGTCPGAKKKAAIVGARGCSGYGEHYTREFAEVLAAAGVDIISGMAKGIDGTGQRAALNAGGKSYAVLGSGVDVCYPRDHIGLYMDIIEHGAESFRNFHREPSACNEFSNEEPDHQRPVRCGSGNGGPDKKWLFDYSRYGTGAGKGCLCPSGTAGQSFECRV